jgi:hypothetical protein
MDGTNLCDQAALGNLMLKTLERAKVDFVGKKLLTITIECHLLPRFAQIVRFVTTDYLMNGEWAAISPSDLEFLLRYVVVIP